MLVEFFINFDGNCAEAVAFYAKVFKSEVTNMMKYGDAPPSEQNYVAEVDKDRVLYAGVPIGNIVGMFSDAPSGTPYVQGNNVCITVSMEDKDEVQRVYDEMVAEGEAIMPLGPTFFSEMFSMIVDKFGIMWQILYYKSGE